MSAAIIDKIRKLRALAQSSNLNEATAAARAAERLIQEHSLAEAEIEAADGASLEQPSEADHYFAAWGKTVPAWENIMSNFLAAHYGCAVVLSWRDDRRVSRIFGRPSDVETVRYQWAFFRSEIVRLCMAHGAHKNRSWRVSFCRGAVRAIIDTLKAEKQAARTKATSSALAVVDARHEAADALVRGVCPNLQKSRVTQVVRNADAYHAGKRAGSTINQRSRLGSNGTRLLSK